MKRRVGRAAPNRDGATACPRRRAPDTPSARAAIDWATGHEKRAPRGKSRYRSRRPPPGKSILAAPDTPWNTRYQDAALDRTRPQQPPRPLPVQRHRPCRRATSTPARPHRTRYLTGSTALSARSCSVATHTPTGAARERIGGCRPGDRPPAVAALKPTDPCTDTSERRKEGCRFSSGPRRSRCSASVTFGEPGHQAACQVRVMRTVPSTRRRAPTVPRSTRQVSP